MIQRISHHLPWGTTFIETWQQTVESNKLMLKPRSRNLFTLSRTPINLENLKLELMDYDSAKATEILNGFTYGFPLNYTGVRVPTEAKNLKSARKHPDTVCQKIQSEVDAGRVAEPFNDRPIPTLRVSPLGLVPKKEPGEFRLILFHPEIP